MPEALSSRFDADAQAYARLLQAEVALAQKNARARLDAVRAARELGSLLLARIYCELGADAEASSELDVVQK